MGQMLTSASKLVGCFRTGVLATLIRFLPDLVAVTRSSSLNLIEFIIIKMSNQCRQRLAFKIEKALQPEVYAAVEDALLACPYVSSVLAWKNEITFHTLWVLHAHKSSPMPRELITRGRLAKPLNALKVFDSILPVDQKAIDGTVEEFLRNPAMSALTSNEAGELLRVQQGVVQLEAQVKGSESRGQEKLVDEYILELDRSQMEPKQFIEGRYKKGDLLTKKEFMMLEPRLRQMHAFHVAYFADPAEDWDMQRSLDHYLSQNQLPFPASECLSRLDRAGHA